MRRRLRWSVAVEGPVVLGTAAIILLVYGYRYEDLLLLNKGALPGVALLTVLVFSALDLLVERPSNEPTLDEYAAVGESFMAVREIAVAAAFASLFTVSMLYIGVIVTTAVFITLMAWYFSGRVSVFYACVAVIVSTALWIVFTMAGGVYFGNPLLF